MQKITHNTPIGLFDYESCFGPELWPAVAEEWGIEELKLTTKDEPDFDKLMAMRCSVLNQHGKTIEDVRAVSGSHEPLEGAREFLDWLRGYMPVILISDMVYQFAEPVLAKLGHPTMLSTTIVTDENGKMVYDKRVDDRKANAVRAMQGLNFYTIAMGDSLNDIGLLEAADSAMLYSPNEAMIEHFPDLDAFYNLKDVRAALEENVSILSA